MQNPVNIEFKSPELLQEYQHILPRLQLVLEDMALYCKQNDQKFIVTDLLSEASEDKKLHRVSKSHDEGRAADIRVRDWPLEFRSKFELHFEKTYEKWAATTAATGQKNLIVIHDNGIGGLHTHVQIAPYNQG